jgi:hypothetical protein
VAPRFARLYLQAVEDGRPLSLTSAASTDWLPPIVDEGAEPAEFACHFSDWDAVAGTKYADPYEGRLSAVGRMDMFGRVVEQVPTSPRLA